MQKGLLGLSGAVFLAFLIFLTVKFAISDYQPESTAKIYPYIIESTAPGGQLSLYSGSSTHLMPEDIARDLNTVIYPEDHLKIFPGALMMMGGKISLTRAPEITINDWGKDKLYRSFAPTVADLLVEKNIDLGNDDKIFPALDAKIGQGSKIKITRVAVTEVSQNQPIDFKIVNKNDPNLDEGKTSIEQAGKKGVKKLTYRVTRENGAEKSRVLIKTETTTQPIDQIVHTGTRPAISVPCRYNSTVIAAAIKYSYSANKICNLMMLESGGNPGTVSRDGIHYGLFQYTTGGDGFGGSWGDMSQRAGSGGSRWTDPTAQIMTTVWALTHGYASKW